MEKNLELSGLIHSRYKSEAACATAMHWNKQRLNRIVNGKAEPTLMEVHELSETLDVPFMTIAGFYLPKGSTNG